jgi:hypothetical protein
MKKALILNGEVCQVEEASDTFPVSAPLLWIECPDDCSPSKHKFDGEKFVPIFTPEEEKESALKAVLSSLDKKLKVVQDGGVLVSGKWFYSDQESWLQYVGHKALNGALPPDVMWDTMDGTSIVRTQALIGTVLKSIDALNTGAYAVWKQHVAAVKASSDPANYDYSTGWPATYQG